MLEERLILGNQVALGTGDSVVVGYVNGYSKRGKIVREDKDWPTFEGAYLRAEGHANRRGPAQI